MIEYKELRIYKYELTKQYKHRVNLLCMSFESKYVSYDMPKYSLVIRRGYKWDGPSGPTIDTDSFMRGSLVHDVLYQAIRDGWGDSRLEHRKLADQILYKICREDGMNRIRAWYTYRCVRLFGESSAIQENK